MWRLHHQRRRDATAPRFPRREAILAATKRPRRIKALKLTALVQRSQAFLGFTDRGLRIVLEIVPEDSAVLVKFQSPHGPSSQVTLARSIETIQDFRIYYHDVSPRLGLLVADRTSPRHIAPSFVVFHLPHLPQPDPAYVLLSRCYCPPIEIACRQGTRVHGSAVVTVFATFATAVNVLAAPGMVESKDNTVYNDDAGADDHDDGMNDSGGDRMHERHAQKAQQPQRPQRPQHAHNAQHPQRLGGILAAMTAPCTCGSLLCRQALHWRVATLGQAGQRGGSRDGDGSSGRRGGGDDSSNDGGRVGMMPPPTATEQQQQRDRDEGDTGEEAGDLDDNELGEQTDASRQQRQRQHQRQQQSYVEPEWVYPCHASHDTTLFLDRNSVHIASNTRAPLTLVERFIEVERIVLAFALRHLPPHLRLVSIADYDALRLGPEAGSQDVLLLTSVVVRTDRRQQTISPSHTANTATASTTIASSGSHSGRLHGISNCAASRARMRSAPPTSTSTASPSSSSLVLPFHFALCLIRWQLARNHVEMLLLCRFRGVAQQDAPIIRQTHLHFLNHLNSKTVLAPFAPVSVHEFQKSKQHLWHPRLPHVVTL
ncbi:hypothetical protein PTSG_12938 [Salpingoeca rosetta]|uniref:Uncharacterized protein n=1 Tax=Salpingoeca rosetta (strain ATCC 50818 / BSB-021) TaxID=946362 RepID=F2UNB8_SALR5|nr:uncharacterized protein PTSG_12938 [Salpingoeca rosetta]EGD79123.1 hypothetical protein PTSG_12938 [Salpingoeca rosetta]|eukprot:XP_004989208.1 hypothetical protein PTSG_12938 [Salpingoeca rosetta]